MIDIPEIIGQDTIKDLFTRSLESGRIPHALIISGEKGCGKLAVAISFAMEVLHTENPEHRDIRTIEFTEKKPRYTEIVRERIVNDMSLYPFDCGHKFYIIKDAGEMSPQAQNALLKSLEEPPEYAHVILLTEDAGKLLPTIRSRSVYLYIKPIEKETIKNELIRNGIEREIADISAALSMGNLRKAIDYAEDPEKTEFAKKVCDVFMSVANKEKPALYFNAEINRFKTEPDKFTELMEIFLRDVLLYKMAENSEDIISPWKDNIKIISAKCSYDRLGKIRKSLWDLKNGVEMNVSFDNLLDILFAEIGGSY